MSQQCKCSMSISMLGDGCRHCQPQTYIDTQIFIIAEMQSEIDSLEQDKAALESEYVY